MFAHKRKRSLVTVCIKYMEHIMHKSFSKDLILKKKAIKKKASKLV